MKPVLGHVASGEQADPGGECARVPHSEQQEASGRRRREVTGHCRSSFAGGGGMGRASEGQRQRHQVGGEGRQCLLCRQKGPGSRSRVPLGFLRGCKGLTVFADEEEGASTGGRAACTQRRRG